MCVKGLVRLSICLCLFASQSRAVDLHDVQLPNGAVTQWVATDMNHNGHGMAIKALAVNGPAEEVLQYYRTAWTDANGHDDGV